MESPRAGNDLIQIRPVAGETEDFAGALVVGVNLGRIPRVGRRHLHGHRPANHTLDGRQHLASPWDKEKSDE